MKWKGRRQLDGQVGWFPKSYVKPTNSSQPGSTRASIDMQTPTNTPIAGVPKGQNGAAGLGMKQSSVTSPVGANLPPSQSGEWFVAVYDFDAAESTDLALKVGDKVLVIEQ